MSAKTKIVVLRIKQLVNVGIIAGIGLLFLLLLLLFILPSLKDSGESIPVPQKETAEQNASLPTTASPQIYQPGIYTARLLLGGQSVELEVIVDASKITSIELAPLNDSVTTMYPLLQPTLDHIKEQVYEKDSLEGITYDNETKYTSLVLLRAIQNALDKAYTH